MHNQHILFLEINYMVSNFLFATSIYLLLFIECLWYARYHTRLMNITFNEILLVKHLAHACPILSAPYLLAGVISPTTYSPQLIMVSKWHYPLSANDKTKTENFGNCPTHLVSSGASMRNIIVRRTGDSVHMTTRALLGRSLRRGRVLCECRTTGKGAGGIKYLTASSQNNLMCSSPGRMI